MPCRPFLLLPMPTMQTHPRVGCRGGLIQQERIGRRFRRQLEKPDPLVFAFYVRIRDKQVFFWCRRTASVTGSQHRPNSPYRAAKQKTSSEIPSVIREPCCAAGLGHSGRHIPAVMSVARTQSACPSMNILLHPSRCLLRATRRPMLSSCSSELGRCCGCQTSK